MRTPVAKLTVPPHPRTGLSYYGRGQIQITHANNYMNAGRRLGVDLLKFPDLALDVDHSARIAVLGHVEGWWRGDKDGRYTLSRFINKGKLDFRGLRNIVNGDRREAELKYYTDLFLDALIKASEFPADEPEPSKPDKGVNPMGKILKGLFGGGAGGGGLNIIRALMLGVAGIFGIEAGTGGDVPLVDTTQMGLNDLFGPLLLWILAEKLGVDVKQLQVPTAGDTASGGLLGSLLGGGGGLNFVRGLLAGFAGIFGIEAGTGGDVPLVDTSQMGLRDFLVPVLLWVFAEKMGVDIKQLKPPAEPPSEPVSN